MAINRQGSLASGTYKIQNGARYEFEEVGVTRIFEEWIMNESDIFTLSPRIESVNPRFPSLTAKRVNASTLPAGLAKVSIEWSGLINEGEGSTLGGFLPDPVYSMTSQGFSNPIQTHPNVDKIRERADELASPEVGWKTDNDGVFEGITRFAGDLGGISTYRSGNLQWTKQWVQGSPPSNSFFKRLWKIDRPSGNLPNVGVRNWILNSFNYTKEGFIYSCTATWVSSEEGSSWSDIIYG